MCCEAWRCAGPWNDDEGCLLCAWVNAPRLDTATCCVGPPGWSWGSSGVRVLHAVPTARRWQFHVPSVHAVHHAPAGCRIGVCMCADGRLEQPFGAASTMCGGVPFGRLSSLWLTLTCACTRSSR